MFLLTQLLKQSSWKLDWTTHPFYLLTEFNSSLLESKNLTESSSSSVPSGKRLPLSSYVAIIWIQDSETTERYIHCLAGVTKLDQLVTTHQCAFPMARRYKVHKNHLFPQYSATLGEPNNPNKIELKLSEPIIFKDKPAIFAALAIIMVSQRIQIIKTSS